MSEIANKYIIYARKSSEAEDRQMASIDSQVHELKLLASKHGLSVVEILTESQSAKEPGRAVFNKMLEKIKAGEADGIICWKLNRLGRNPVDNGQISWYLQREIIKHILTYERSYYPTDNVLLMAVEQGMANQFILDLSVDSKRGLRSKAERGWFPGRAPLGYKHHPLKSKGEKEIISDPKRFEIVRTSFKSIVSGEMTPPEAYRYALKKYGLTNRDGGRLSLSNWYAMLNNPFYYGEFEYPRNSGNWYKGKHKPLISQSEFQSIQNILGKKGTTRPKKYHFTYRGFLNCGTCGAFITAENKVKRNKNGNVHSYVYYHCTKRKDPSCPEKTMEEKVLKDQIIEALGSIDVPPSFKEWAEKYLERFTSEDIESGRKLREAQERHTNLVGTKLDELLDLRLEGKIKDEDYQKKKMKLDEEKEELTKILNSPHKKTWLEEFKETLSIAEDAKKAFDEGNEGKQKQVLTRLGSNLLIKSKRFVIQEPNAILYLKNAIPEIRAINSRFEPVENALQKQKLELCYSSSPIVLRR